MEREDEHIKENWESSKPILFEHVVMSAAVPLLPVRIGFSLHACTVKLLFHRNVFIVEYNKEL